MTVADLEDFIANKMKMAHIYQPVMLLTLLQTRGESSEEVIAWAILAHLPHDQGQIEYYKERTRNMVGEVLQRHKIVERQGEAYKLNGFNSLTENQINSLVALCKKKLAECLERRYRKREKGCKFCELQKGSKISENELAYAMYDEFPVTELHTLIIPRRHVKTYFELGQAEINACNQLLAEVKSFIEKSDKTITGFNIGVNDGEDAGQTIFHCHIYLIPRRKGDVENPRGGIRHVIPGKGCY
jgi:diadenosine tetraphosphate (Ap4A) HIT family hydrolase